MSTLGCCCDNELWLTSEWCYVSRGRLIARQAVEIVWKVYNLETFALPNVKRQVTSLSLRHQRRSAFGNLAFDL